MSKVIDLLCDLIAIPSVTPLAGEPDDIHGERRVAEFLRDRFSRRKIDFETQEVWPGRPNLIAHLAGRGGPSFVFEAHTDTVGVDNMEYEPFSPRIEEGRVLGRGACDNKGSLAAMVTAFEAMAERGAPPGDVTLAATCDEEFRASGVQHLVDTGFRADGGVVGEPTGLHLVIAHKGALRTRIVVHGRAAHSSEPEKGESAIYHAARLLTAIEDYNRQLAWRPKHPLVQGPTVSVGMIQGGQAPNIVPDLCEIVVDRRVVPGEVAAQVEEEMRSLVAASLPGGNWEMIVMLSSCGMETPPDSPIVRRCARALDQVIESHQIEGVQYGTDASRLSAAGTPAVVIGPGDIAQAHTAREWVAIAQVEAAVEVYRRIMNDPGEG